MSYPDPTSQRVRILIINPNTSQSMTAALREPIESLGYSNLETQYSFLTPPPHPNHPTGLSSINSPDDAALSTAHVLRYVFPLLGHHDAFLVACFSPHPLVHALKRRTSKPVIGIFEASVASAVQLLTHMPRLPFPEAIGEDEMEVKVKEEVKVEVEEEETSNSHPATTTTTRQPAGTTSESQYPTQKFGIITTTDIWGPVLDSVVRSADPEMLGPERAAALFAGVQSVGLDAMQLHGAEPEAGEVDRRFSDAVKRLVQGGEEELCVIVLGCAGMVGMEKLVREEWAKLRRRKSGEVWEEGRVVDGVKAGIGILQGLVRAKF